MRKIFSFRMGWSERNDNCRYLAINIQNKHKLNKILAQKCFVQVVNVTTIDWEKKFHFNKLADILNDFREHLRVKKFKVFYWIVGLLYIRITVFWNLLIDLPFE